MRSSRERVPTSVQPHPQAPSEPSESWGPARAAARRALLAIQKPAGRRRKITAGRRALGGSRSAAAVGRGGVGWVGSAPPQSRAPAASGLEARQMPAASCKSHAPSPPLSSSGRSPPSSSTQSWAGERDPPPARPAAVQCGLLAPARSHPPAGLQLAGVHGQRSSEGGGRLPSSGRAALWARGPVCRRGALRPAAGASPAGMLRVSRASRLRSASPPPPLLRGIPAICNNVELPGHRVEPRSLP